MPIDYAKLKTRRFADVEHDYGVRDTILYALGIGCGVDPMDAEDLRFVYEHELRVLPTMAAVLAYPGFWLKEPDTGVDWRKVLHGEQGLVLHQALPASGTVVGRTRVSEIVDQGPGKHALLYSERDVAEKASGERLCTLTSCSVLRGEGGFGGPPGPVPKPHRVPDGSPRFVVDRPTLPQSALVYRLSGDDNPLHADPKVAAAAGFPRPILHGLCTFGVAGRALLKACCGDDQSKLKSMSVRFTAPVFPGETIRTEIWRDENVVSFRSRVVERDAVVLDNGYAELA
jgi:acyl dehydratase